MSASSLTALSQRSETFWLGAALLLLGGLVPDTVFVGGLNVAAALLGTGAVIIAVRLVVAIVRIGQVQIGIDYSGSETTTVRQAPDR